MRKNYYFVLYRIIQSKLVYIVQKSQKKSVKTKIHIKHIQSWINCDKVTGKTPALINQGHLNFMFV